ncbi:signal peptide peptidase SppA [Stappia taiwanensis]|uniref:Signal peptide peptidase SppA n=1 Tax=Stappia taiwanensis TaxID=992267 RepID=A0A838XSQ9_9HYPH|nr:signal peptide peptidase SppA [Stappia taiwanensis]MBA4613455.1 signal peptide peptidase SppA [Stappia taiwanensis]GGF02460.1 Clp protease [Stappia taiwanensis]
MSLDADAIVDRRRLRRKLTFWRVAAFLVTGAAVLLLLAWLAGGSPLGKGAAHIARVEINGVILNDRKRLEMLHKLAESDAVKAVILDINSPGGSTVGGESLYQALREIADKKPVVAHIGTLGASAGYMAAIAADHVIARHTSLTGSIGVYIQYGNFKGLLDTLGVEFDVVRSGPLKAEPNFFSETPQAVRDNLQAVINDSYDWFVARVAERRNMTDAEVRKVATGGIYSGESAQSLGLVDALGGEKQAVAWLEKERGLPEKLPVITWAARSEIDGLPFSARIASAFGSGLAKGLGTSLNDATTLLPDGVTLDGLVSVWHARQAAEPTDGPGGQ